MRITKVYTRTGDKGLTRLAGGQKVRKDDLKIEAYGTIDELNSIVGICRSFLAAPEKGRSSLSRIDRELYQIQNRLFDIGGLLATAPGQSFKNMPKIRSSDIKHLESFMDACQKKLQPLKEFILPGGGKVTSFLHLARTVCRRAERICYSLHQREPVSHEILAYLNRLSDTFFVLSRWISWAQNEKEVLWSRKRK